MAPIIPPKQTEILVRDCLRTCLALPAPYYLPLYLVPVFLVLITQLLNADYLLLTLPPAGLTLIATVVLWALGFCTAVDVRWPQVILAPALAFLMASHFVAVKQGFSSVGYALLLASSSLTLLQTLPAAMSPAFKEFSGSSLYEEVSP